MYKCKQCGENNKLKMMNKGQGRRSLSLCKSCHNKNTIARGQANKILHVIYKGSKCELCGYDKCLAALEFHHIESREKEKLISRMRYHSFDKVKPELDKCKLVCSNCHREIHYGEWDCKGWSSRLHRENQQGSIP